jgi:hypothetical protein
MLNHLPMKGCHRHPRPSRASIAASLRFARWQRARISMTGITHDPRTLALSSRFANATTTVASGTLILKTRVKKKKDT